MPNESLRMSSGKKAVTMVIDGACSGNPSPGGWACLLRFGTHEREYSGHHPDTTNNRMELEAAIQGFRQLKEACSVTVITDSQYVQRGMLEYLPRWKANGWLTSNRGPVRNRDLWEVLDSLTHEVTWKWVRGHSGHPDQERCDGLANTQATSSGHQFQIA
jgi:ribonuclease HI